MNAVTQRENLDSVSWILTDRCRRPRPASGGFRFCAFSCPRLFLETSQSTLSLPRSISARAEIYPAILFLKDSDWLLQDHLDDWICAALCLAGSEHPAHCRAVRRCCLCSRPTGRAPFQSRTPRNSASPKVWIWTPLFHFLSLATHSRCRPC